jgi:Uma2 family endonuclease
MNRVRQHVADARHRLTVSEAWAMRSKRIFGDLDFELVDGEIIPMADDGGRTIEWNAAINAWLVNALTGREFVVVPDKTLVLSEHDGPKPDFYVYKAGMRAADVRGPDVLLLIEVSDTTINGDLGWKADLYAQHGIREYWVIDIAGRCVHVHRLGESHTYGDAVIVNFDQPVTAAHLEGVQLTLSRLRHLPPLDA